MVSPPPHCVAAAALCHRRRIVSPPPHCHRCIHSFDRNCIQNVIPFSIYKVPTMQQCGGGDNAAAVTQIPGKIQQLKDCYN
jgi:hypothetical protein